MRKLTAQQEFDFLAELYLQQGNAQLLSLLRKSFQVLRNRAQALFGLLALELKGTNT